jgi:hypothetical protein
MGADDILIVRVPAGPDDDAEDVDEATRTLRACLLELDVASVDAVRDPEAPGGAKGVETLVGWLAVPLGQESLKAVIEVVVSWARRGSRSAEITIDGETLKVSGISSAQQGRFIDEFFDRHAART